MDNILSLLIGAIALVIPIVIYLHDKKQLVYELITLNVLKENEVLKNIYIENSWKQLSKTRIFLRNEGKKIIYGDDILESDKLRIEINNGEIIYYKIFNDNLSLIKSENDQILYLKFEHLPYNIEYKIDIYHTGLNNNDISLKGKIRDMNSIIRREYIIHGIPTFILPKKSFKNSFYYTIILTGIAIWGNLANYIFSVLNINIEGNIILLFYFILFIITYIIIFSLRNFSYWLGLFKINILD